MYMRVTGLFKNEVAKENKQGGHVKVPKVRGKKLGYPTKIKWLQSPFI